MSSIHNLEQASMENVSEINSLPNINITIKQEVHEANEIVTDYTNCHNATNIANEFNIKEEILDSNFELYYSNDVHQFNNYNISDRVFECNSCDYKSLSEAHLIVHAKIHTAPDCEDNAFSCTICTYKTKRKSHFNDHVRSHTGDKPHECSYCDYKSGLKGNLKRHITRIHTKPSSGSDKYNLQLVRCAHCSYSCPNKHLLIRHVKMHVLGQNKNDSYNLRSGYSPKRLEPLMDQQPEFVDIHSLSIDQEGHLTLSPVKYEDQPCDFSPIKSEVDYSQRNMLKCKECKYTCIRKTHLNDHLKTHSGEKPFVCILCNYRTGHKSHLTRHMKVHLKKEGNINVILNIPPLQPIHAKKQVYRCLVCGYKSQVKHCFAKHMRLHLGVALYTCNICDFSAKCSADIKQHIKIHEGQTEFGCNSCDYRAKSKGRLRRHIAIHRSIY